MLKGIRKRISRRKPEHGDTLVAANGSLSDDRDSSQDGTVTSVVTPTKEKTRGKDQSAPAAAIYQLAQSTDDDDDIYEESSVSSDERENQRKPYSSPKNAVFIQGELEALRIRQIARNLRKDLQEMESQSTPQLTPLATSATEAFYLKQREQKKEWKRKEKDSRNYLTSYRGAAGSRKDDSIKTKNYIRSHAPPSGSGSPMDNFYLQQRAMNQEWKQKQRDANAFLHRYRGYTLDKSSNGVSYDDLLVWQKQAAAIPLPPSPRSDLDTIGALTTIEMGPLPTLRLDDRPSDTLGPRLVPLKPRSTLEISSTDQEDLVQTQQQGDYDKQRGIGIPTTIGETNGDNQTTKKEAIVVRESAETDNMGDRRDAEVVNDENETTYLEESSDIMNTGVVTKENFGDDMPQSEKLIGNVTQGGGTVGRVSLTDCVSTDKDEALASNSSVTGLIDKSGVICAINTNSMAMVHEDERGIISMAEPTSNSLTPWNRKSDENEEIPEGPDDVIVNKNYDDSQGLAPLDVETYSTEIADKALEASEDEDFLLENENGCLEDVDDMLRELLGDKCLPELVETDTDLDIPTRGTTSQVEVCIEARVVSSREQTSKIPKRIPTPRIIKAKSNDCTLNKVDQVSKAVSRRSPNVSVHPRDPNYISTVNVHRATDASLKKSGISPKLTPSSTPPRRSENASNIVSAHVIRTPTPRISSPSRSVSSTTSARSYRSRHDTPDAGNINYCTGKLVLDLHDSIDGCDNCLAFATPAERLQFQQDGNHYRVNRVRGGCSRSCAIFPRNDNEPPVRLCRQCFYGTHYRRTPAKTYHI